MSHISCARSVRTMLALVFAASIASSPRDAFAFATQGNHWENQAGNPVVFRIHPDGSDDIGDASDLEAFRKAFATWDSVACSYLEFVEGEWQEPRTVNNDGVNRLFFVENMGEWPDQPGTLALTFTFYRTADKVITDADMIINGVNWRFTTNQAEIGQGTPAKVDLETVVLHEIGHFFGLDHSQDTAAVMYPTNNKPMQREPAADDVQGICSLYSNGMPIPNPNPMNPMQTGAPVGSPCRAATDCASNRCVDDQLINRTYCTEQCNPQQSDSCPAGYECALTQEGNYCLAPAVVDELCDVCDQGAQCASGFCTTVAGVNNNRPFCSRPCDPTPGQPAQCAEGYSCMPVLGAVGGACSPNNGICEPLGKGGQNEVCYANGSCKPGFGCVEYFPSSGLNFCYFSCSPAYHGLSCGPGTQCRRVEGRDGMAVCFSVSNEGQPCIPEICDDTSFCAMDEAVGIDSALCYRICNGNEQCGANSQCQAVAGAPNLCVPNQGFKFDGDACSSDAECASAVCRTYGQNRLCTRACATTDAASCSPGLKCLAQDTTTQGLCWPESYLDPAARERDRRITMRPPPAGFCSCDYSNACDEDCDCDTNCSGCSCTAAAAGDAGGPIAFAIGLVVALAFVRRSRRR